ncbi:MAG TPA: hypothetical protein PLP19_01100 [bacterium]|nr:hypothetical protein [bacterium]HPN42060.1 hypothetical protein [bacterium]
MLLFYIIMGILIYWILKIIIRSLFGIKPKVEVKGSSQKKPLDLTNQEVEDIDFKEIKE